MASKWLQVSDAERALIKEAFDVSKMDEYDPNVQKFIRKLDKADKRISVSSAKQKGKNLQFFVCDRISRITGVPYDQGDDHCLIHSREMGQAGTDIVLRGDAYAMFRFDVECKSTESLALMATVEQARANTTAGRNWLIVHKNKRLPQPIVILEWDAFEEILVSR